MSLEWYAVRVATGREGAMERALASRGFDIVLPMRPFRKRRARACKGRERAEIPLIPGYLFVRLGPASDWAGLCAFRNVFGVVGMAGAPRPISAERIERLREIGAKLDFASPIRPTEADLAAAIRDGGRVEVLDGPYAGTIVTEPKFYARSKGSVALIEIDIFGSKHEAEVAVENLGRVA